MSQAKGWKTKDDVMRPQHTASQWLRAFIREMGKQK